MTKFDSDEEVLKTAIFLLAVWALAPFIYAAYWAYQKSR